MTRYKAQVDKKKHEMKSFWVKKSQIFLEFIQPGSLTRLTKLHIDLQDHPSFAYVRLPSQQVTELHIDPIDHPSFAYARLPSQQVTESHD